MKIFTAVELRNWFLSKETEKVYSCFAVVNVCVNLTTLLEITFPVIWEPSITIKTSFDKGTFPAIPKLISKVISSLIFTNWGKIESMVGISVHHITKFKKKKKKNEP